MSTLNKIDESVQKFANNFQKKIKKIKEEHTKEIKDLLKKIADNEQLEYDYLINKYLNNLDNDNILEEIEIDEQSYYYENKENGKVYNSESKLVGTFTKGKVQLA